MDLLDVGKLILQYAVVPLIYLLWDIWRRVAKLEKDQAVTQVLVDNIRDDIKEIRHGIDQLISRQLK